MINVGEFRIKLAFASVALLFVYVVFRPFYSIDVWINNCRGSFYILEGSLASDFEVYPDGKVPFTLKTSGIKINDGAIRKSLVGKWEFIIQRQKKPMYFHSIVIFPVWSLILAIAIMVNVARLMREQNVKMRL